MHACMHLPLKNLLTWAGVQDKRKVGRYIDTGGYCGLRIRMHKSLRFDLSEGSPILITFFHVTP